jgi:hypothetical protein
VPVGGGIGWNGSRFSVRLGALDSVSEGLGEREVAGVVADVADVGELVPVQAVRGAKCGLVCAELVQEPGSFNPDLPQETFASPGAMLL